MREEAELRKALSRLRDEERKATRRPQAYKLSLFMAIETILWALGENEDHPYANLME